MSDDGAGKIGAVAAERRDAAVGSGTDESGDDRNKSGFEERQENSAAALFCFVQLRLSLEECVASENEIGGGNRNSGDSGFFERSGEETRAESFAERGETIG